MIDLADSIKRLRDNCTDNKLWAHAHNDCIQTINQLVELVAEMRDTSEMIRVAYILALDKGDLMQANMKVCMPEIKATLTKADALLTGLK